MNQAEHGEVPDPPDFEDNFGSQTGVEYLNEGVKYELVKEQTETNQIVVIMKPSG